MAGSALQAQEAPISEEARSARGLVREESRAHHKSHNINNDSNMHGQNSIGFNIFRFRMRISHEELLEESLGLKGLEFSVYSSQLEAFLFQRLQHSSAGVWYIRVWAGTQV